MEISLQPPVLDYFRVAVAWSYSQNGICIFPTVCYSQRSEAPNPAWRSFKSRIDFFAFVELPIMVVQIIEIFMKPTNLVSLEFEPGAFPKVQFLAISVARVMHGDGVFFDFIGFDLALKDSTLFSHNNTGLSKTCHKQ